jgi:hypothetical protein
MSMGRNIQHGHGHAASAWTWTCSMEIGMYHGHWHGQGYAAWTRTYSKDMTWCWAVIVPPWHYLMHVTVLFLLLLQFFQRAGHRWWPLQSPPSFAKCHLLLLQGWWNKNSCVEFSDNNEDF